MQFGRPAEEFVDFFIPQAIRRDYHLKPAKSRDYGYAPQSLLAHILSGVLSGSGLLDALIQADPQTRSRLPDPEKDWPKIMAAFALHDLDKARAVSRPVQELSLEDFRQELQALELDKFLSLGPDDLEEFCRFVRAVATHRRDPDRFDFMQLPPNQGLFREVVRTMDELASAQTLSEVQQSVERFLRRVYHPDSPLVRPWAWRLQGYILPLSALLLDVVARYLQERYSWAPALVHSGAWLGLLPASVDIRPDEEFYRELADRFLETLLDVLERDDELRPELIDRTDAKLPRVADFWLLGGPVGLMDRLREDTRSTFRDSKGLERRLNDLIQKMSPDCRSEWSDVIQALQGHPDLRRVAFHIFEMHRILYSTLSKITETSLQDWLGLFPTSRPLRGVGRGGGYPWELFWVSAEYVVQAASQPPDAILAAWMEEANRRLQRRWDELRERVRQTFHWPEAVSAYLREVLEIPGTSFEAPGPDTSLVPKSSRRQAPSCTDCGRTPVVKGRYSGEAPAWVYAFELLPRPWQWSKGQPAGPLQAGALFHCPVCEINAWAMPGSSRPPFIVVYLAGASRWDFQWPASLQWVPGAPPLHGDFLHSPLAVIGRDNMPFQLIDYLARAWEVEAGTSIDEFLSRILAQYKQARDFSGQEWVVRLRRSLVTDHFAYSLHVIQAKRSLEDTTLWTLALWVALAWGLLGYRVLVTPATVVHEWPTAILTLDRAPLGVRAFLDAFGVENPEDDPRALPRGFWSLTATWLLLDFAAPQKHLGDRLNWTPTALRQVARSPLGGIRLWNRAVFRGNQPPQLAHDMAALVLLHLHRDGGRQHMTVLDELAELSWALFQPYYRGPRGFRHRATLLWREAVRAIRETHRLGFTSDAELIQMISGRLLAVLNRHVRSGIGYARPDPDRIEAFARLIVEQFYKGDLGRLRQVEHQVADWLAFSALRRYRAEREAQENESSER